MKMSKAFLAVAAFVLLSGPLNAHSNLIWDWTGDCQRTLIGSVNLCTHAMVHAVTTDAYVPGTPGDFGLLEWRYTDDLGVTEDLAIGFNLGQQNHPFLLPASSGQKEGAISIIPAFFESHADGTWRFEAEGATPDPCNGIGNPLCSYGVVGVTGTWTRVPEPSTLMLLGVGLVGLGWSHGRKRFLRARASLHRT